jgi:hypothetical protein
MPSISARALASRNPNDSCSNDNEQLNSDGSCRKKIQLDLNSWSNFDTTEAAESSGDGGSGSVSAYNTANGYMFDEQWISCVSDSEQGLNNNEYLVQGFNFVYEIYTPAEDSNDDVLETLADFERNLSLGVSKYLGLLPCADSEAELSVARSAGPWLRRSLTSLKNNHRFLGEEATSGVLAVSMMPKDEIDYASACTSNVRTDEPAACSPVVGGMTAWINKADGASFLNDDTFLKAVESYIADDNSKYLGNGLLHVEYIGELDSTTHTKMDNSEVSSGSSSMGRMIVGLALASVTLVAAVAGGGWLYRKKKRTNQYDEAEKSEGSKSEVTVKHRNTSGVVVVVVGEIQPQETVEVSSW